VAGAQLVVALAALGVAGGPVVHAVRADQAKAALELVNAHDLGRGWSGTHAPTTPRFVPTCSAFHPDESGVVVTARSAAGLGRYDPSTDASLTVRNAHRRRVGLRLRRKEPVRVLADLDDGRCRRGARAAVRGEARAPPGRADTRVATIRKTAPVEEVERWPVPNLS
jgi:hypothetical protein